MKCGLIWSRFKISAGNILLGERAAARAVSTGDRHWIRLGDFMAMAFVFWVKVLVEAAINETGVILETDY